MTTDKFFPSLEEHPRLHFAHFERKVYDNAGCTCVDLFPTHGLLFLVVSDRTWASLPGNSTIVDGVPTVVPRPTMAQPPPPADNATAGAWKSFEHRRLKFTTFSTAAALLLQHIKDSLPPADSNLLSHPVLGLVNFSSLELMEHLRQQYGTFQTTDYSLLYLQLEQKISATMDFPTLAAKFRLIFEQFSAHNQPLSELQKCTYLSTAIASVPHLVKTQETFFHLHPNPQDRQYLQLAQHISLHAPNFMPTTSDLGYVASATSQTPSELITAFLDSPQLATLVATAAAAAAVKVASQQPQRFSSRSRPAKPTSTAASRVYCYLHGYDWHSGIDCKKMAKDPANYPPGAPQAKTHLSISGGNTTKL